MNFTDWREDVCQQDDEPARQPHCHRCFHALSLGGGECEDECFCDPATECNCYHCKLYRDQVEQRAEKRRRRRERKKRSET